MIWSEIEKRYGKKLANKMKKSEYLIGITVEMKNGQMDIPESDIHLAWKDATGKKIHPLEID
jgi:hypothetical protein